MNSREIRLNFGTLVKKTIVLNQQCFKFGGKAAMPPPATSKNAKASASNRNNNKIDDDSHDDGDFERPIPKRTKYYRLPALLPTPTSNVFDALAGVSMDTDVAQTGQKNGSSQSNNNNTLQANNNNSHTQKPIKPKPIVLPTGADAMNKAIDVIKAISPEIKFFIDRKRKATHIVTKSAADKETVIKALKDKEEEHFTYAENTERHAIFALHKLPLMDAATVLILLKDDDYPAEHVKLMRGGEWPVYLVFFKKNSTSLNFLNSRRYVDHSVVQWTPAPSNKRPAQCKRCQRWGHSANHCGFVPRCVKCDAYHLTKDCLRRDRDVGQPKCVNCGKEGHPANSPTCEAFIAYNNSRLERRRPRQHELPPQQQQEQRRFEKAPQIHPWSAQGRIKRQQQLDSESPLIHSHEPLAPSTSRAPFVNAEFTNRNTNAPPQNDSRDFFTEIKGLREGFRAIPDLGDCIDTVKSLLQDLQNAKTKGDRESILFCFMSARSP